VDLSELFALVPVNGMTVDFLSPPPTSPLPDFTEELASVARTPTRRLLADLTGTPGVPDAVAKAFAEDPRASLRRIVATLRTYWDLVLATHWPRMLALLQADVLWRTQQLALGGAQALFEDLHETITWEVDTLSVTDPWQHRSDLAGEGLLLMPSAMAWPAVRKLIEPYQPVVAYPARGVATLWETGGRGEAPEALESLVGSTRAKLLLAISEPSSTTSLALRLSVSPPAVSQHLAVLVANGLAARARVGRTVLYHRTARGDDLVG